MSSEILFIFLQLGSLATFTTLCSRMVVARYPNVAVGICVAGLFSSVLVLALSLLDVPRLGIYIGSIAPSATHPSYYANSIAGKIQSEAENGDSTPLEKELTYFPIDSLAKQLSNTTELVRVKPLEVLAIAICLIQLVRLLFSINYSLRLRKSRIPCDGDASLKALNLELERRDLRCKFQIYRSELIDSPCVTWLSRTDIYVPYEFASWTLSEQLAAIAHETAHAIRRDAIVRLLSELCYTCVCFQPLLWLLRRELWFAQELATDKVASKVLQPTQYRRGLAQLALRMTTLEQFKTQVSSVSVFSNTMIRRIKMLKAYKNPTLIDSLQCTAGALIAAALCLTVVACKLDGEEPIRIAKNASSSKQAEVEPSEAIAEHTSLGARYGYLVAHPKALSKLQSNLAFMQELEEVLNLKEIPGSPSLSQNLDTIESSFTYKATANSDRDVAVDQKYRIDAATNSMRLHFDREFNWSDLADKINFGAFARPAKYEPVKEMMKQAGTTSILSFLVGDAQPELSTEAKQIFSSINGDYLSLVCNLGGLQIVNLEDIQQSAPATLPWWKAILQCETVGLGCHAIDEQDVELRIIFSPLKPEAINELHDAIRAAFRSSEEADAQAIAKAGIFFKAASKFHSTKIWLIPSETSRRVLVNTKLSLAYFQGPKSPDKHTRADAPKE